MQKTLAEYNSKTQYPVLTWANDPEFNVLIWLQNNRQTQNWHDSLSVDILDVGAEYIEVDGDGDPVNVSDVWVKFLPHNNPDEEGIYLQLGENDWLQILPLDATRIEEFFEGKKCYLIPTKKQVPQLHSVVISKIKYL
jgi:hypothetical protein